MYKNRTTKNKSELDGNGFPSVNQYAAGIDISVKEHLVAVGAHCCEDYIRAYDSDTNSLRNLVDWLKSCKIQTVAMESTGVYWIQLFSLLQQSGMEVILVNPVTVKNISGRKTDESDAAWIQRLHSYGLLKGSFQPEENIRQLRSLERHRKTIISDMNRYINRVQKCLEVMNIKIHVKLSDIMGKTGQLMLEAIIAGQRDPQELANLADPRIKKSKEELAKSLVGMWTDVDVFLVEQNYNSYKQLCDQLKLMDVKIEKQMQLILAQSNDGLIIEAKKLTRKPRKNDHNFNAREYLIELTGIDLTRIEGLQSNTVLTIISETGIDMTKWSTKKHFESWLSLAPNNKISGGQLLKSKVKKTKNAAGAAFRMAAFTLSNSNSELGKYKKKMVARGGEKMAIIATARKMAGIFYTLLRNKEEYDPQRKKKDAAKQKEAKIKMLEKQIEHLKAS